MIDVANSYDVTGGWNYFMSDNVVGTKSLDDVIVFWTNLIKL